MTQVLILFFLLAGLLATSIDSGPKLASKLRALVQGLVGKATASSYLHQASKALLLAVVVFAGLPYVLRLVDPAAGSFDLGTICTLALAALQFAAAAHIALWTYKRLLPGFYDYLADFLQDKVLENLTGPLEEILANPETLNAGLLPLVAERRKLLQFKFLIRCARLLFCLLPLFFFFVLAQSALTAALTVVPH